MNPTAAATVRELIDTQAALRPQAPYALAAESDAVLSYAALHDGCRRIAAQLDADGVPPGGVVSLLMPNGPATLQWLLGAMWAGRVVNPVNLLATGEPMRHVLEHAGARLLLVSPDWEEPARALAATLAAPPRIRVVEPGCIELPAARADAPPPAAGALALLMYTSGTTGRPKGVMLSQSNLAANARSIAAEHALTAADRVHAVLPLYHINAFAVTMLAPLASGGSLCIAPRFSAARYWDQVHAGGCTWINVVPTIIAYLLEAEAPPPGHTAALRFCRSASAALPPGHLRAFERRFGVGVIETMGLTETVAPSFSNPLEPSARKLGAVGRASGCEARVVDAALQPVPDGRTGELVIRGPNVMAGYYRDAEATAAAFTPDGWLRTGDLGHRDADGFFFVTGRLKELIIKGGENIAPREIDEVLLGHPAVLEAAVVGVPDRHYGQQILACVVLRPGHAADEASIRDFVAERLGRYKAPARVRFLAELPRGPSGKVQRLKLAGAA